MKGTHSSGGRRNTSGLIISNKVSGVAAQGVIEEGIVAVPLPEVLFDLTVGDAVNL